MIREEDLRIDVFRHGAPLAAGDPVRNPIVKITHLPTGISRLCSCSPSEWANKVSALAEIEHALSEHAPPGDCAH